MKIKTNTMIKNVITIIAIKMIILIMIIPFSSRLQIQLNINNEHAFGEFFNKTKKK